MRKFTVLITVLAMLFFFSACAPLMKYEPPKMEPPKKLEQYSLPPDPFVGAEVPKAMYLTKLEDGTFKVVPKEESTIVAYTVKEHDKIVLRLQFYKELTPALVKLINVHVDIANAHLQLQVDQELAKELYKQFWIDAENKRIVDKRWDSLEKGGYWAIILGQLIALILAL